MKVFEADKVNMKMRDYRSIVMKFKEKRHQEKIQTVNVTPLDAILVKKALILPRYITEYFEEKVKQKK